MKCDFVSKPGHTGDRCYVNPDNPNHLLPTKLLVSFSIDPREESNGNVPVAALISSENPKKINMVGLAVGESLEKRRLAPQMTIVAMKTVERQKMFSEKSLFRSGVTVSMSCMV